MIENNILINEFGVITYHYQISILPLLTAAKNVDRDTVL